MAKYERKTGDPSYDQLAEVLPDHALDPRAELRKLAVAMTCNVAPQNVDAQARNHSFLIVDDAVSFAPLYDVAPTVELTKLRTAALRVGGEDRIERISVAATRVTCCGRGVSAASRPAALSRAHHPVPGRRSREPGAAVDALDAAEDLLGHGRVGPGVP
jgi:serine/threonine protein kinase HipA of HipAB toxin-antitoxin module